MSLLARPQLDPREALPREAPPGSRRAGARSRALTRLRDLSLFVLSLLLTGLALDRILPPMERASLKVKLDQFARNKDDYNALLVGSSQSFRGFDPSLFDECLQRAGVPARSFNLALPGAQMSETHAYLERVAELRPANLRWVFVEADWIANLCSSGDYLNVKNLAWRDWECTRLLWQYFAGLDEVPLEVELGAYWRSLVGLVYHTVGVGRGVPWVERALGVGVDAQEARRWLGPRGRGHENLDDAQNPLLGQTRLVTEEELRRADREIREQRAQHFEIPVNASAEAFFHEVERVVRSMGAEPIFFSYRGDSLRSDAVALDRARKLHRLLRFDDPARFPELFDVRYRFDGLHYNRAGAERFTRYFAQEVVQLAQVPPR